MYLRAVVVLSALVLTACAGTPVNDAQAKPVPADRQLTTEWSTPAEGSGRVLVKRDAGFAGSACATRIFVNAKPAADINESEKVEFYLPAGDYVLAAWPKGVCGGRMAEIAVPVKAGSTYKFRVGYGSNGDFAIGPTAF